MGFKEYFNDNYSLMDLYMKCYCPNHMNYYEIELKKYAKVEAQKIMVRNNGEIKFQWAQHPAGV